ncbi:MAG: PepSY domain-containing protein [Wenzhouxiangella sp.]|jgi:hypothetical protein|nr:PepSY domain-containing protein [Wenzhouxiangella sp.]
MPKVITIAVFALTLAAGYSLASSDSMKTTTSRSDWLPMDQIAEDLQADGYELREIEIDDNHYEIEAITPDGRHVEIYIDPVSGKLLKVEEDD